MNTTSIPEFATAELTYRRSRIVTTHRPATGANTNRRRHHSLQARHAA